MNQEKINSNLREKTSESSQFQRKVLEVVRKWMKSSAEAMSPYHSLWDDNAYLYRAWRLPDKEDDEAARKKEPGKLLVPVAYAQIQTALSFILSTFSQRDNIFELRGRGPEDEKLSMAVSVDLQYQLEREKFTLKLYHWLLDAFKQGFGVVRMEWTEDYAPMRVAKQVPVYNIGSMLGAVFGQEMPTKTEEAVEDVLQFQGNTIRNISPYGFYPDPNVSIADFQKGMFVGSEEEVTFTSILAEEGQIFHGTDKIPKTMAKDLFSERARRVKGPFGEQSKSPTGLLGNEENDPTTAIRLEMEVTLSEKTASELFETNLGKDTKPVKWLITIINDQKVVRFERVSNLHNRYSYHVVEFSPDHDSFYNPGLISTVSELQEIVTFFLNSHVKNVRQIISNRFIVDPNKVEMDDVTNGRIFIRTRGAQGDISRAIQQLTVSDITREHVGAIPSLLALLQTVTGVNENALGQYSSGRRSATEARNVNAGSAARLKMHALLSWLQGIRPLGEQMLSNTRQWRTKEVYESIVGKLALEAPFEVAMLADPTKLAGGYDFIPYDATLPTDRQFQAGVLQELFGMMFCNPASMQLINKDPVKLLNYIAQLYGIKNLSDFDLSQLPTPAVVPNEEAQAAAAVPGAESVDMSGEALLAQLR